MTSPSGWVNFQDLLELNRGTAERTADTLAGNIEGRGAAAERGIASAGTYFDRAAQLGTNAAGYAGPRSLMDSPGYGDLAKGVYGAAGDARRGTTDAGRLSMLQASQPGATGLDAALAGAAGGARFDQARARYGGLGEALGVENAHAADRARQGVQQSRALGAQQEAPRPRTYEEMLEAARQKRGAAYSAYADRVNQQARKPGGVLGR